LEENKLTEENDCPEITEAVTELMKEKADSLSSGSFTFLADLFMSLFMKENSLGPCFRNRTGNKESQNFTEEQIEFLDVISPKTNDEPLQLFLLTYFSKEGEDVYKNTKTLTILFFLDILFNLEITSFTLPECVKVWRARYHMIHNQLLTSNVCYLQDKSLEYYREFLDSMLIEDKQTQSYLWVEYANCCLTFFKYSKAEQALEKARALIGVKLNLTGKMGKRTKYQKFDIPQLVLNIESEKVDEFIHPEVSPVDMIVENDKMKLQEAEGEAGEGEESKAAHRNINLDEECVLLDKVKLKDEEESSVDVSLCFQIYINALVWNELHSQANEYVLQYERLNAYIEKVLERSNNWLIFSMSLFLRSKNEQEKLKTRERSMIQMQTLIDQFNDEEPNLGERCRYVYTNPYPLSWNLKKQLGYSYQSIGVYLSAFDLFNELDFYEDAAQCMVVSGKITQAEKYIDKVISEQGETSQIYCLLGDLKRKDEYYEKAWELSKHRNARAMRSLGMMKFQRGLVDESIECLKKALDINKLYPSSWYTLGCAYVKKEQFEKAIFAFGNVVSYDESHGEAWSNIASAYMQLGKLKEAQSCLEHAVKSCRENWKIWENLIMLYLHANMFMRVVSSIKQLLYMQKMERVNVQLMLKVANCFIAKFCSKESPETDDSIERHRVYLFELFDRVLQEMPKDTGILRLYGRLVHSLENENRPKIVTLKLREVKSLLTAGWQYDLEQGQKNYQNHRRAQRTDGREIRS
jgi:tetratricopeptide (TPR) repeat protein